MNMKTKVLFILLMFAMAVSAQSVFVVQGNNQASAHGSLLLAINAASDGDYVYMPGGTFNIGNLKISKRLNLIGAGHYPDSTEATGRTSLTGNIYFKTGASSSTLQGIYLSESIFLGDSTHTGQVSNILISRCNINTMYMSNSTTSTNRGASNVFLRECILRGDVYGANTQGVVVENSIISGQMHHFNGGATFRNNIFLYSSTTSSTPGFYYIYSSNFVNNIFRHAGGFNFSSVTNNTFSNCIFVGTVSTSLNSFSNCKYSTTFNTLFVNVANSAAFSYTSDYKLTDTSAAKAAGLSGTDCGIYGGDNPYKEGAVPMNPHISFKNIPSATDSQGKLNIQIRVAAQDN
jgi:hypothetical protein